ncbi:hypothetical protein MP638_002108 [Amoeboaphelidium occidentale]|nr:hypothetical protein MP638_002108 [Amoeboaphelidium occidentale]
MSKVFVNMKLLSFLVCASLIYCAPPFPSEADAPLYGDNFELNKEMTRDGMSDQLSNDDVSEQCTGRVSCLPFKPHVAAHNMLTYVGNAAKTTLSLAHKTIRSQGDRFLEKHLFYPTYPDYEWVSDKNHLIHDVPVDPDIDGKDEWYMNMMKPRSIFNLETHIYDPDKNQKWDKVLLFFPGNCMDMRISSTTWSDKIFGKGFRKIFVEYPGYGTLRDIGSWTASPENFILSARAITAYLVRELKIDPSKIIVVGYSLGSGSATEAALGLTKFSDLSLNRTDGGPSALILLAPFYKIQMAANHVTKIGGYLVNEKFKNYKNIIEITCPTLFVHGHEDQVLSAQHTKMLSNAQISKDRQQVSILAGRDHLILDSESVQLLVRKFLRKYEQEENQ